MEKQKAKATITPHIWLKDEMTDKELWSGAFNAVASSLGCRETSTARIWADTALKYWKEYKGEVRK